MAEHQLPEGLKPASCVLETKAAFVSCLMRLQQIVPGVIPEGIGPQYAGLQLCQLHQKLELPLSGQPAPNNTRKVSHRLLSQCEGVTHSISLIARITTW